jgi:hypothetical protein
MVTPRRMDYESIVYAAGIVTQERRLRRFQALGKYLLLLAYYPELPSNE